MKKYIISVNLGSNCEYTFTGSDADASFAPSSNCCETNDELTRSKQGVSFNTSNSIHITKARILSPLAPLLQAGSQYAGQLSCAIASVSGGDVDQSFADFDISFSKWNEWEKKDIFIPANDAGDVGRIIVYSASTTLSVHDFNIQEAYVGEKFTPCLEVEVETDFMLCDGDNF